MLPTSGAKPADRSAFGSAAVVSGQDWTLCLALGSAAEIIVSVCCPLRWRQDLDVTGTALNLIGPLLLGVVHALDEASSTPEVHNACAAFQTGFVGVLTSFSFMVDQSALLAASPHAIGHASVTRRLWRGWLYICFTMVAGSVLFLLGRTIGGIALRARSVKRSLLLQLQQQRSRRWPLVWWISCFVGLLWCWVLMAPPGTVFNPLEVHAARTLAGLPVPITSPVPASKGLDLKHLVCGMSLQAAGLAASMRIEARAGSHDTRSERGAGIQLSPLACNCMACLTLILLRVGETSSSAFAQHAFFAAKLRTSYCGALSVSGGLPALFLGNAVHGEQRDWSRHRVLAVGLNFAAHAYIAAATAALLLWLPADIPHYHRGTAGSHSHTRVAIGIDP